MSAARAERVVDVLLERELGAIVVTDLVNIRWLTGFTGTNAIALVGIGGQCIFFTDFRYVERAKAEVEDFEQRRGGRDLFADVAGEFQGRIGFEDTHLPVRSWERLKELAGDDVELVGTGRMLEDLRAVKEPAELDAIRASAQLADDVVRTVGWSRGSQAARSGM